MVKHWRCYLMNKTDKIKNPCIYHPDVELECKGRANWYCKKCKRNVMLELVLMSDAFMKGKR